VIVVPQSSLQTKPPREDVLALSLDQLQQTLAANDSGREQQWAEAVGYALARLEAALRKHRAAAQRPDGPLAEVDQTRPTLARQADDLRSDYDEFLSQILALREQIQQSAQAFAPSRGLATEVGGPMDINAIREQSKEILAGLQKDRQAETNLVLESVNTDIGAGD
jgi:hypothetical protein